MSDHDPYDVRQPFDPDQLLDGFTVETERVIRAEDDPTLAEMAERARQAWDAFMAGSKSATDQQQDPLE